MNVKSKTHMISCGRKITILLAHDRQLHNAVFLFLFYFQLYIVVPYDLFLLFL